ncbi:MAG: hypothetical protein Q8Q60_00875 [Candidatus Chromulinivorax sp.]|nr:hypothetical protein [Candidatus Chromulinivorax sp.]
MKIKQILIYTLLFMSLHINAMHENYTHYEFDKQTATPTSENASSHGYESDDANLEAYMKRISNKFLKKESSSTSNNEAQLRSSKQKNRPKTPIKLPTVNKPTTSPDSVAFIDDNNYPDLLPEIKLRNSNSPMDNMAEWLRKNDGENFIEAAAVNPNFSEYQSFLINNPSSNDIEYNNNFTNHDQIQYQPIFAKRSTTSQKHVTLSEKINNLLNKTELQPTRPTTSRPSFLGGRQRISNLSNNS